MAVNFVTVDRETPDRFPASVQEYLPEDHLARFVVEIVDRLDLSRLVAAYAGTGSRPYPPAMLVALLFYGYATGVFSSRKRARATHDSIAFRYICANTHPDHRTIADFRKRFLDELAGLFTAVLLVAQAMGLLKLGTVSLDGTQIKANASKHQALGFAYANRLEEPLKGEVAELLRLAAQADHTPRPAPLAERLAADPPPPQGQPTPAEATAQRLRTRDGQARYAQRKATVETVFGIIKQVQGFRQFLLRGLRAVQGEWALVCMGWYLKRLVARKG